MVSIALSIIVTLLVVGLFLWAVDALPWINADIKKLIHILIIVVAVLWVIQLLFGTAPGIPHLLKP